MPASSLRASFDRHPLARETALAVLALGGLTLWLEAVRTVAGELLSGRVMPSRFAETGLGAVALNSLFTTSIVVLAVAAFVAAYLRVRDVSVPLGLPDRSVLPWVAVALVGPAVLVALVDAVGGATGTHVAELVGSRYAPGALVDQAAVITGLGLALTLPSYLLVTHLLVQRTLRAAASGATAVALTTAIATVYDPSNVLNVLPFRVAAVSAAFALAVALPVIAAESFDAERLPWLCAVPLAIFVAGVAHEWVVDFSGLAGAAYALSEVAVVAFGATAYERTDSVLPSAVALAAFTVGCESVAFFFEAGVAI